MDTKAKERKGEDRAKDRLRKRIMRAKGSQATSSSSKTRRYWLIVILPKLYGYQFWEGSNFQIRRSMKSFRVLCTKKILKQERFSLFLLSFQGSEGRSWLRQEWWGEVLLKLKLQGNNIKLEDMKILKGGNLWKMYRRKKKESLVARAEQTKQKIQEIEPEMKQDLKQRIYPWTSIA